MKVLAVLLFVAVLVVGCKVTEPIPEGKIYVGNINIDIDTMPYQKDLERKVIYRNHDFINEIHFYDMFKLQTHFCIDRKGTIIYAEVDRDSTVIKDFKILKACLNSFVQYKFQEDKNAPFIECGTYNLNFNTD